MLYLVVIAVGLYGLVLLVIYKKQDSMLFHPRAVSAVQQKAHKRLAYEEVVNEQTLKGWLVNPGKRNLIIYYGGNAEELSSLVTEMQGYENVSSLLLNYRGYGESSGEPSESAFYTDGLIVFDRMKPQYDHIILVGRSLGSGVASYVAGHREVDGVVLITPYDSIENVAKETIPWAPMGMMVKHKFESHLHAKKTKAPGLFIVAGNDKIISKERSQALYDVWAGKKKWYLKENLGHNDFSMSPSYDQTISNFVGRVTR